MAHVLVGEHGHGRVDVPVDAERWICDGDAAVGLGCVIVVALVLEHGHVGEDGEPVGESARYEELAVVVLRELDGDVTAVGGGALADIDGHVEHSSPDAADEFGLGEGRTLEMESAHHSVGRARLVVLYEVDGADLLVELLLGVALEEISP